MRASHATAPPAATPAVARHDLEDLERLGATPRPSSAALSQPADDHALAVTFDAIRAADIGATAKIVLFVLAVMARNQESLSQRKLARDTGLSRATLQLKLRALRQLGCIREAGPPGKRGLQRWSVDATTVATVTRPGRAGVA